MESSKVKELIDGAVKFEGGILRSGNEVRDKSKPGYGRDLLDSRLILMAAMSHLVNAKSGIPGKTDKGINDRMTLIALFLQGTYASEVLISEGQYFKAAATLKQDYEILTRIGGIKASDDKDGKVPNVKHAPKGSQRFYGELNDLAHIAKQEFIEKFMRIYSSGEIKGVSPFPQYNKDLSIYLYELHVWIMFQIYREHIHLFIEMYGDKDAELQNAIISIVTVSEKMKKMGFVFV